MTLAQPGARVTPGGTVIQLAEAERFETVALPEPEPGPGDVVIEMRALGICGTDLHLFHGRDGVYPHVVGHDGAAVVRSVGPGVTGLKVGERVAIDPITRCGACDNCRRGQVQLCPDGGYLGMIGPGLLAQYVRLPAAQAVRLPASVSDLSATVLEPVTVALHTRERVRALQPDPMTCAVVGGGPLGILLAVVLRHYGYACHVFEPEPRRRELASAFGLPAHPGQPIELGTGPRLVVETSAAAAGVALADALCTPGSLVAVVGRAPHSIAPASILLKELSLLGIKGGPGMYAQAADLVDQGVVDPSAVITHEFNWAEANEAFELTGERPNEVVRSVLRGDW